MLSWTKSAFVFNISMTVMMTMMLLLMAQLIQIHVFVCFLFVGMCHKCQHYVLFEFFFFKSKQRRIPLWKWSRSFFSAWVAFHFSLLMEHNIIREIFKKMQILGPASNNLLEWMAMVVCSDIDAVVRRPPDCCKNDWNECEFWEVISGQRMWMGWYKWFRGWLCLWQSNHNVLFATDTHLNKI